MATVGAYIRFDGQHEATVRRELSKMTGVELFELDQPGMLGLIVEADSIDAAHAVLTRDVRAVDGVTGAFPIYVNIEDESDEQGPHAGQIPNSLGT